MWSGRTVMICVVRLEFSQPYVVPRREGTTLPPFFWRYTLSLLVFGSTWYPTAVLLALHPLTLLFYRALLGTPSFKYLAASRSHELSVSFAPPKKM